MKRTTWKKRLTGFILSVAMFATGMGGAATKVEAAPATDLQLAAKSAILLEASTGKILYSMNPDAPLPPASMSKMMAEYLVLEAVKEKKSVGMRRYLLVNMPSMWQESRIPLECT
ncbi:D-alanyl-D-alanine carboxypeptidase precursor [Brevibacillus agri BAB-2500]|nr:D-alanyl-D-alanine carboxypeptidase precursor [Brevibacillus agri BAB-2500]